MENRNVLLSGYLAYRKGCGLSSTTIRRDYYLLKKFFRWLEDTDIRDVNSNTIYRYTEHLRTTKSRLGKKSVAPATIGLELSTLKGFFEYLLCHEKILINPLEGMKIKQQGYSRLRKIFSEKDISTFLDSIPVNEPWSQRDRAIFELMYSSGLRIGDVKNLEIEHLNPDDRILMVRGKGAKDAYLPFSEIARKFLVMYLKDGRKKMLRQMHKEDSKKIKRYVFISRVGTLNYRRFLNRFHKYIKECGLKDKGYTLHSIRHATGTHLLAHGASIRYVQELLRHEDLKTTQLYTRPSVENIKSVYMTYHPRCNEYYKEVDVEYMKQLKALKDRLIWGRKASIQYKRHRHKKGFGQWKGEK